MRRIAFLLGIFLTAIGLLAQQTVTVQAQSYQVSDNLDLEAVAITFGESKNVEDFERRLNDPDNRISNLDSLSLNFSLGILKILNQSAVICGCGNAKVNFQTRQECFSGSHALCSFLWLLYFLNDRSF